MVREIDQRNRWCEAFVSLLVEETGVGRADALFLAEQARVRTPSLPPSYALKMALLSSHCPAGLHVAGLWWPHRTEPAVFPPDDASVGR